MINRIFLYLFVGFSTINYASAQDSLNLIRLTNENTVFFSRVIDGTFFTVDRTASRGEFYGSRLFSKVGDEMVEEVSIDQIGDSLNVNLLQDLWKRGDQYYMLLYTSNLSRTRNYFTLARYDRDNKQIIVLDNEPFIYYTPFGNYDFKDLYIDGIKTWLYIEYVDDNFNPANYVKLEIVGDSIVPTRFNLTNFSLSDVLYDSFYDEVSKEYYMYGNGYLTVLYEDFSFKYRLRYKSKVEDELRSYFEIYIMGRDNNKIRFIERLLDHSKLNLYLNIRENIIADSLIIPLEFKSINKDEDCYLVRKVFKEKCNYLFYSKSIINGFNTDYGFKILVYSKKGDLLKTFEIPSDEPITLFDIDIDEKNMIIYGNGGYRIKVNQFVFTLKVDNLKVTSTTNPSITSPPAIYPNPTTGRFYISDIPAHARVAVLGIDGRKYYEGTYDDNSGIDLSSAPAGIYVVSITSDASTQIIKVSKVE